jgi:uncharacterized repeat protein (TIGR04138 family)
MSLRDQLPRIIALDPRYPIEAYAFVLEALHHARNHKLRSQGRDPDAAPTSKSPPARRARTRRTPAKRPAVSGHVTGRELCEALRKLALRQYGLLAVTVLAHWGIHSTSDVGNIVYNMIATGDLERTPSDSRSDFDKVFDFETALRPKLVLAKDELT